ncbi:MAG: PAS domain S-box protein [Anaerolineae bacterium]|nr:PAS domain S-box protein [Anaerolineae bacterium]
MVRPLPSRSLMVILVLVLLGVLAGGGVLYYTQYQHLLNMARQELQTIARLKVDQIMAWRQDHLADAAAFSETLFSEVVQYWMNNPQDSAIEALLTRFRALQEYDSYDDVLLVDAAGTVRLSLSGDLTPLPGESAQALATAWRERRPALTDLHVDSVGSPPHIDVIAPLFASRATSAEPIGAVILRSNAADYLYPLIQSWPTLSQSAETLLVRRDGDSALFLNELRHRSGTALTLRIPLTEMDVPAVRAVLGEEGAFEGKDYRGVDVIAYLRAIPGSSWHIVAKVDRAEILAEWDTRAVLILGLILGSVTTAIMLIGMIWQRNEKAHYRNLYRAEKARQESEARYRAVLLSIGDAVIVTDLEGRVELLNPVAEALTGWRRDEAQGRPLEEVFRIVSEETRQPAASPVQRVLQEGIVVGLANHTLLLARDGREIPIADSGAPIFDIDGNITGVVLVFRDQTEERAAQKALEESEAYIRTILDNLPIGVAVNSATPNVTFDYINDNFVRLYRTTREALSKPDAFWEAVYQDAAFREAIRQRVLEDIASGDPERMYWEDVPITREGEETTYISAAYTPIRGTDLMLSTIWDTTARKRAEEALRESEERYRSLFENNHAVMLIIDPATGAIIDANPAASAYYGWTRDELRQMRIDQINTLPPDEIRAEMQRAKAQERNHFLFKHRRADGTIRNVEVYSGPIEIHGQKMLYSIVHDITDRVLAEAQVRLNEARLQSLVHLSQNDIASIQQLLEHALNEAARLMESQIGYLCLYDEDSQTFSLTTWFGEAQQAAAMPAAPTTGMPDVTDLCQQVIRQRAPVVVNTNPVLLPLASPAEGVVLTRQMSVPVFSGEKIVAVAGVGNREPDYTPADATQLALLMDSVWRIVERRQAEEAEREHHRLTEALRATAAALIGTSDLQDVMATLLENIAQVIPHDAADIMLITEDQARIVYWRGYPPEIAPALHNICFPVSQTRNLQQMSVTGRPVLIADTSQYADWRPEPLTGWIRSHIGAPIHARGKLIGFLNLNSHTPNFFNENHADHLKMFADLASVAVERARLFEQVQRYADELEQRVIERTAQLNHAKERTEAILNSSSDVIILCRPEGTISQANPAFEATFGCQVEEMLNQPFVALFLPDQAPQVEQALAAVLETCQPGRLEATAVCTRSGNTFDADIALSPIVEQGGRLAGIICTLRDISLRKQLEAQLRQAMEQAMKMNEMKSRYLSMAAHDLRNPLAVIQSAVTLLERYWDRLSQEKKQEKYAAIRDSVRRMVELLDDILVLGRAESGKLTCNPAPVDLVTCCQDIITEVSQASDATHFIDFSCRGADVLPLLDVKLLWHILSNLLSNAIKYSPAGSTITFTVDCEPDVVTFRIQDRGIGIPEDAKAHMFESFYRAPNVGFTPGTGLGLAIVRQLVELHGGTITFESQEGIGTTFTVSIPQPAKRKA